jgi:hypothetical protein
VAIWRGSERSKKVEIVEGRLRDALASQDREPGANDARRPASTKETPTIPEAGVVKRDPAC